MGLSRNKVAVPEGAAGTPPFWRKQLGLRPRFKRKSFRTRELISIQQTTKTQGKKLRRRDNKQVVLKNPFSLSAILLYEYSIDSSVAQLVRAPH